jgi:iron complex outermembrane receptor protein
MKSLLSVVILLSSLSLVAQNEKKFNDTTGLLPIEIIAIRAADNAPFAKSNINKATIEKNNLGQDLPFILNQVPGVVVNSDAGNGVGYTGIRIRGTDATRINVTLNGIPYNDAESQGTFFVNLPDIISSANSIQVQRGVGTSSNGAAAFGGTINLATNGINDKFYAELNNSAGSFNTWKNTFRFGSGLIGKHFSFDGRLSRIVSDGFIDRASSDLKSYFVSAAYINGKSSLRMNIFSGKEKTYQAWYGIPESKLKTDRSFNPAGNEHPGSPYSNETDNYLQTHYQLFFNHQFNPYWKVGIALFSTRGAGYYEGYKSEASLLKYGLSNYFNGTEVISETDLIRRLWLDNHFYGTTFNVQHQKNKTDFAIGGGWNKYGGNHFGEIVWAKVQAAVPYKYRWYDLNASKSDFSLYTKINQQIGKRWQAFADVQLRMVKYTINGFRENPNLFIKNTYDFLNPKFGLSYSFNGWRSFISYAVGAKEPNRDDFEAGATQQPKAERLNDIELGLEKRTAKYQIAATLYYMNYHNQLVLTGKINDVGAYTRSNIDKSYRAGIELDAKYQFNSIISIAGNIALSENKIKNFTAFIDDYDNGGQQTNTYKKSTIAYSPSVVGGATLTIVPIKNAEIHLIGKYVSRQYLDNTTNKKRSLNPYYVQDVRFNYTIEKKAFKKMDVYLQLNNIFNKKYEANGYTFSYVYNGNLTTENYYFPMAPFNIMAGINISL